MRAVLWDMDGTLIDSEKLWDISMAETCRRLGGEMTPELRTALLGGSAEATMKMMFAAFGLEPDPELMARAFDGSWTVDGGLTEGDLTTAQDWLYQGEDFAGLAKAPLAEFADLAPLNAVLARIGPAK